MVFVNVGVDRLFRDVVRGIYWPALWNFQRE